MGSMGGGGSSSSGTQTTIVEPPAQVKPYLTQFLQRADALSKTANPIYQGNLVAGFSPLQQRAINSATNTPQLTSNFTSPSATNPNAMRLLNNVANGQWANAGVYKNNVGATANHYAGMQDATAGLSNAYADDVNRFSANNYINSLINNVNSDTTRDFDRSVTAGTNANFARSGAFGGSAWREASQNNSRELADRLARNSTAIRAEDLQQQRNLEEARLGRMTGAEESRLGRINAANQNRISQLVNAEEARIGRMDANNAQYVATRNNVSEQERDRIYNAVNQLNNLQQQGYNNSMAAKDLNLKIAGQNQGMNDARFQKMYQMGDLQQQQQQKLLEAAYNKWLSGSEGSQRNLDILRNAINTVMGSGSQSFQSQPVNGLAQGLGAASSAVGIAAKLKDLFGNG